MSLTFNKLDEYLAERRQHAEKVGEKQRAMESALEAHHAAKASYESTIRRGVVENIDVTAEVDAADDLVQSTAKEYERRKREYQVSTSLGTMTIISADEVWAAWRDEFIPQYRETKFNGVLAKLLEAKQVYAEAVNAYRESVHEVEELASDVRQALGDSYYYKIAGVKFGNRPEYEKYLLLENELNSIHKGA